MMLAVTAICFYTFTESLHLKLDSILCSQSQLSKKLDCMLKTHSTWQASKIASHEKDSILQTAHCDEFKKKNLLNFEVKDKELNMIIQGLPSEHSGQNTKSNVENLSEKTESLAADSVHETKWYVLPDKPVNGVTVLRRPKARPILISLHNELEIQSIFKSVSKIEGSGICITTDLLPVLNNLHSSLLIKGNDLRERGLVLTTRIKQKGAKIWSVNKKECQEFLFSSSNFYFI